MSTRKESSQDYMSLSYFSNMIYNDFLFDIPKILDICVIFYEGNPNLVSKMIENLFTNQPKYLHDLKSCSKTIVETVTNITEKLEEYLQSRKNVGSGEFEDMILYATDLTMTLTSLFEACSRTTQAFYVTSPEFTVKLAYFYQHGVSAAERKINDELMSKNIDPKIANSFLSRLLLIRSKLVAAVRATVVNCVLNTVIEGSSNGEQQLEEFLNLYNGYLSEITFFKDYTILYPIDDDLDIFKLRGIQIDTMRIGK